MQTIGIQQKQLFKEVGYSDLPISADVLVECLDCIRLDKTPAELLNLLRKDPILYLRSIELLNAEQSISPNTLEQTDIQSSLFHNSPIHRLIKSTAVQTHFQQHEHKNNLPYARYWHEARHCALIAELLAKASNYPYPQEAYLAGLLHNFGQLIRLVRNHDDYSEIYIGSSSPVELELFEKEWFGSTSAQLTALLSETLLDDSFLSEAMLFQLETSEALLNAPNLVRITALASRWIYPDFDRQQLHQDAKTLLNLSKSECEKIENSSQQQLIIDNRGIVLAGQYDENKASRVSDKLKALSYELAFEQSLTPAINDDEKTLWASLIDNYQILFGKRPIVLFKIEAEKIFVQAVSSETPTKLLQISFNRNAIAGSSLSTAITEQQPLFSTYGTSSISIIDQQLCRYLRRDQLQVIPLFDQSVCLGILVVGYSQTLNSEPQETAKLSLFMQTAHHILQYINQTANLTSGSIEQYKEHQSEALRKLVHESANPLGVINNYVEVLKQSFSLDLKTTSQLETIRKEINRVSRLLNKIRDIDTTTTIANYALDLNRIIRTQADLLNASLFKVHNIRCDLELEPGLPEVSASTEGIKQILLNLLKNAVEAIGSSGHIVVRTRGHINFNGRVYTELMVSDNGPGIDSHILAAAFSPVPTQKGGSHSGLGLTIVSQLVQEMGGFISCQNSTDSGAEFRILLPSEN